MNPNDLSATPLAELYKQVEPAVFAEALTDRYLNGGRDEAEAFLRDCDGRALYALSHFTLGSAPWHRDLDLWLAFARLTTRRGVLFSGGGEVAQRTRAFSEEMQALAKSWIAEELARGESRREANRFVLNFLFRRFAYQGMSSAEAISLLRWAWTMRGEAGVRPDLEYEIGWQPLIEAVEDTDDLIALAEAGGRLCKDILADFARRSSRKTGERWRPWYDFFRRHPELEDYPVSNDVGVIAACWPEADAARRRYFADCMLTRVEKRPSPRYSVMLDRFISDDPQVFAAALKELDPYWLEPVVVDTIWAKRYPELVPLLLPLIAGKSNPKSFESLVRQVVAECPDALLHVEAAKLAKLVPLLDAVILEGALPQLGKVVAGSSSKALREALAKAMTKVAPARLAAAGWLAVRGKNMQLACRDILLAHPDAAAGPLLAELLAAGGLDAVSASTVEARLQQLGLPTPAGETGAASGGASAADGADALATAEAQAAKVKRIAAAVQPFDVPEVLAALRPLSEHAARVLFHLAATAEGGLPPMADQLLAQLPTEGRARLALAVVETWVALEGEPKQRWMLKLLPGNVDDRAVDKLAAAAFAWGKPKKLRAVLAVEQLGALDTLYALARVQEIAVSRKVKDAVIWTARQTLAAAAAKRKLSVPELLDELTPDFGLGEGVTLNVGPRTYRIVLQGDLSLRVVDEKGKASKTIPAAKDEAARAEWDAASARLKTLSASLKAIVKQQEPRMREALVTGKRWPAERWRRLFLAHPLLRIVGRSLVWRLLDAPGLAPGSFRIAEDFSLVDVEDNLVTLPEAASVALWHPATAAAGELEAWRAYLADYELEPLVDQLGAPAEPPAPELLKDDGLQAPADLVIAQEKLAGLLAKWGYRPGPIGDGAAIWQHRWSLPSAQLCVELAHDRYMPYMELGHPVPIEGFTVYDTAAKNWKRLPPGELPKPLLATLAGQLQAIAAKAA